MGLLPRSFAAQRHRRIGESNITRCSVAQLLLSAAIVTVVYALYLTFSFARYSTSSDFSQQRTGSVPPRTIACPLTCPDCTQVICPLPICGDMVCNCPPHVKYDSLALLVAPSQHDLDIRPFTSINGMPNKRRRVRAQTVEMLVDLKRPPKYHDLPLRSNGVLCFSDLFGQLNNQVIEMYKAVALAHRMDRTVVAFEEFSRLIDVSFFQNLFPGAKGKVVIPFDDKLCVGAEAILRKRYQFKHKWLLELPAVSMKAANLFTAKTDINETQIAFYQNLMPQWETQQLVDNFVERTFGNRPFVAVHLRWLEGYCPRWGGGALCDLSPLLLEYIIKTRAPSLVGAPIFIASDSQRRDIEILLIKKSHAVMYKNHYGGKCHGRQCAHVDFEIAARANFFVGVNSSSAARVIDRLRVLRPLGKGVMYDSVLKWGLSLKEKLKLASKKLKRDALNEAKAEQGHDGPVPMSDLVRRIDMLGQKDG